MKKENKITNKDWKHYIDYLDSMIKFKIALDSIPDKFLEGLKGIKIEGKEVKGMSSMGMDVGKYIETHYNPEKIIRKSWSPKETLSNRWGYAMKISDKTKVLRMNEVKENMDETKARIKNQLRIHWFWLKDKDHEEVSKFVNAIINKKLGKDLK